MGNLEWEDGGSQHLCQKGRAGTGGEDVMGMGKVGRGHREGSELIPVAGRREADLGGHSNDCSFCLRPWVRVCITKS